MTTFIILAAALVAVAVLLVIWPLLRPKPDAEGKPISRSVKAAVGVIVAVPVLGFILYFQLSNWWSPAVQAEVKGHGIGGQAEQLQQVADRLEQRLQREQGDVDGWKMLGRTYVVMEEYPKALNAYQHAYTLTSGKDVDALLGYAEARVLVNEDDFDGEAGRLFEQAAQTAPDNPKALWYAGLTAFRKQDLATARKYWSTLRSLGGPEQIMHILDQRLAEIDQQIGPATGAVASTAPAGGATMAAAATKPAAGNQGTPAAASGGIQLHVVLAPQLVGRAPADAPLFVLARTGAGGPPAAAIRRSSNDLPLDVTLSDANAMIAGATLEQAKSLELVARISLTGRPIPSSGDLYGEVRYDPSRKGPITLTIDQVVD